MKTLKCDICEEEAQGETFEEWMMALMPHYMEAHADFMKENEKMSQEEQMEEKKNWEKVNRARFDEA